MAVFFDQIAVPVAVALFDGGRAGLEPGAVAQRPFIDGAGVQAVSLLIQSEGLTVGGQGAVAVRVTCQ